VSLATTSSTSEAQSKICNDFQLSLMPSFEDARSCLSCTLSQQ